MAGGNAQEKGPEKGPFSFASAKARCPAIARSPCLRSNSWYYDGDSATVHPSATSAVPVKVVVPVQVKLAGAS